MASGLATVLEAAIAAGAVPPSFIAVADAEGRWLRQTAALDPQLRSRAVIAAVDDRPFVDALRLGVGGALRLPPSTVAAAEALTAAAATTLPSGGFDPAVAGVLAAGASPLAVVSIRDRGFWRRQLGDRVLSERLLAAVGSIEATAAVLPWPALVLAAADGSRLEAAWRSLADDWAQPAPSLDVRALPPGTRADDVLSAAHRELATAADRPEPGPAATRAPVHELPSGRAVGWWSPVVGEIPGEGWLAVPETPVSETRMWRLHGDGGGATVVEALLAEDPKPAAEAVALRVPGWAAADLRAGKPAALLVARLADAADRRGLPLWVPNVDGEGLRFVLGLPGTLWVDGPAVPR